MGSVMAPARWRIRGSVNTSTECKIAAKGENDGVTTTSAASLNNCSRTRQGCGACVRQGERLRAALGCARRVQRLTFKGY